MNNTERLKSEILSWMVRKQIYIIHASVIDLTNKIIPFISLPLQYADYRKIIYKWAFERKIILGKNAEEDLAEVLSTISWN